MDWITFAIFFAACFSAGLTGALFPPGDWYATLAKPRWTPPDWMFPVVWMTLYVCMAAAGALAAASEGNGIALALWALQIALNTLWSPVFFGLKQIKTGMLVLIALWASVAATMVALWSLSTVAGLLFVPYLLWVTTAGALNAAVWRLNPAEAARNGGATGP